MAKPRQILSAREKNLIVALFKEGKTDEQVAKVMGMRRDTFRQVLKYNGLNLTIKKAKEDPDEKVERSLFERACGYSHKATKFFSYEGEVIEEKEYIEHYPPDTGAAIFWLCNRQPDKWKNVQKIDASGLMDNFAAVVKAIREEERGETSKK